jgi:hypothetical protein
VKFEKGTKMGDLYSDAMKITNQEEADRYLEALVEFGILHGQTREEATNIQKQNLGYFAGYYNNETMARVNRLFKTKHPVFGDTTPTPEEAFQMGMKAGERMKKESEGE